MIRDIDWQKVKDKFLEAEPFNYAVIDNFFLPSIAEKLSSEFPEYNFEELNVHENALENKRTMNRWDRFPPTTYKVFNFFGQELIEKMRFLIGEEYLWFDFGLNGGGWHMHSRGGNNNVHLDYNIHPKLGMQRKLNIIVYMTKDWNSAWGGGLELWTHDEVNNCPEKLVKTIDNRYNRAIIFDTTQNSWHGLPNYIDCPDNVVRKSLAGYYVRPAPSNSDPRGRALFSAREDQKNDPSVHELIKKRSSVSTSHEVYRQSKK